MGGKNHQPCGKYVPESVLMSKTTSEGLAALEIANSFLEDALLVEIYGGRVEQSCFCLNRSITKLTEVEGITNEILKCIEILLVKMDYLAFQDENYCQMVNFQDFRDSMIQSKIIIPESKAWKLAQKTIQERGFRGMFLVFKSKIAEIQQHTARLKETFLLCYEAAQHGNLVKNIEENKISLRQDFARSYLAWLEFSAIFTCSSLISTELHLRRQGFKSMMQVEVPESILCEVNK